MRLKNLFTVPEGQKVTEKVFGRVLVSSICSILLCMTCLFSTTWAWFAVDIENRGNVIEIASVTVDTEIFAGGTQIQKNEKGAYDLETGTYRLQASVTNTATEPDAFGNNAAVYVVMTVGETEYYFAAAPIEQDFYLDTQATVSFAPSWIVPNNALPLSELPTAAPAGPINDESVEEITAPMTETVTGAPTEEVTEKPSEAPSEAATETASASAEED